MRTATLLVGCALSFSLFLAACGPGLNVTFKNQTDGVVTVWRGVVEVTEIEPGEETTYSTNFFPDTRTYRITDADANLLFEKTFTFDELEEFGDIVVTSDGPAQPDR